MELLSKLRQIRATSKADSPKTVGKAMSPIYDRIEQQKVISQIEKTLDSSYSLFWRISVATGWRTTDVCELSFDDIDFSTGIASIVVNKQTKAAEARAYNKVLRQWKEDVKKAAALSGDAARHMIADTTDYKDIASLLTEGEVSQLEAELLEAVSSAPVKRDSKKLPEAVLIQIKERMAANHFDRLVFSRRLMKSNRAKNIEGNITRQCVWKALSGVFNWLATQCAKPLRLSAYSSRKTFAYNMLKGKTGSENNIGEVMQSFGHSSIQMTMKYLGLASKADELQAELAEMI